MKIENINSLDDEQVIRLFNQFQMEVLNSAEATAEKVKEDIYPVLKDSIDDEGILGSLKTDDYFTRIETAESAHIARTVLNYWSQDSERSKYLSDYLSTYKDDRLAIGAILEVGMAMTMIMVAGSIKLSYKEGKFSFSYSTHNISEQAIKMCKSVVPDLIKTIKTK